MEALPMKINTPYEIISGIRNRGSISALLRNHWTSKETKKESTSTASIENELRTIFGQFVKIEIW